MRDYLVFVVQRTAKIEILDEPIQLKHPNLICVHSGSCTEAYAQKIADGYKEAYVVEATKRPAP